MTNGLVFILTIFFCFGCATRVPLKATDQDVSIALTEKGIERVRYKLHKVYNEGNSRSMILSRQNYLLDFYRQSRDPYFGSDRWSAECIRRNHIGELKENSDGFSFKSHLTASPDLKVGFCADGAVDVVYIVGQCRQSGLFYEITAMGAKAAGLSFQCPESLVIAK